MASNQVGLPASPVATLKTMISLPGPTDRSDVSYETASAVARLVAQAPVLFPTTKPCAYLTGGWVRDRVLGKSAADVDVEVFGVPKDRLLVVLQERFPHRVIAPSDNPTAPIKVLAGGGLYIDITIPIRSTAAHGSSRVSAAPAPEISVAEAASRRDFSCNAIYFDPIREQYIDPEGGLSDLSRGILRLASSGMQGILDIGVALRACRFIAQFGFELEPHSEALVRQSVMRDGLDDLPAPFLTKEIRKLLCECNEPAKGLRVAESLGVLSSLFPAVAGLRGVPQDSRHHPEGDVLEHTLLVVDAAALLSREYPSAERFKILLAALLHDVGKLTHTKRVESNGLVKITAYGHEHASAALGAEALKKLSINSSARSEILRMVRHHMRLLELDSSHSKPGERFDNEVRKLVRDVSPADFPAFLTVCRADRLGRGGNVNVHSSNSIFERIEEALARCQFLADPKSRLLKGADLERLGFSDAQVDFGLILRTVETSRDAGALKTTQEAERFVLRKFALRQMGKGTFSDLNPKQREDLGRSLSAAIAGGELRSLAEIVSFMDRRASRL